jgi:hypothetical protein
MPRSPGQLLVELALSLPVILFLTLGMLEGGFLLIDKLAQDRATAVVAAYAAGHPDDSWNAVAERELAGCDVSLTTPLPDVVEVSATCRHATVAFPIFNGLPISSRESAVVR